MTADRYVQELSRARCEELLGTGQVGRVVLTASALPTAIPVTYAIHDGDVVFRAGPGLKLDSAAAGTVVAFEVDSFDESRRTGWSVLATGVAAVVTDLQEIEALDRERIPSWVDVHDPRYVRLSVGPLTGRAVSPSRPEAACGAS